MKLNLEFPEFERLITQMGAQKSSWQLPNLEIDERHQPLIEELQTGIEISLEGVGTSFGGLLTYKGEQVVLYIKDTRQDRNTLLYDIERSRRFHVCDCETLDTMRQQGRLERYVVTTRKDGKFRVEATDPITGCVEEIEARLAVCMNCLSKLKWKGWIGRKQTGEIWENFSLQDFFAEFACIFRTQPPYSDKTAPRGGYAKNWHQIATAMKQQRNWRCDQCGVNLSEPQDQRLLHGHHKNGAVYDNRASNLEVLCLLCHAEQPAHQRMKPSITDKLQIEALRRHSNNVCLRL